MIRHSRRFWRPGEIKPGMLIAVGALVVLAFGMWLFGFWGPKPPPVDPNAKPSGWRFYHCRSGKVLMDEEGKEPLIVPLAEARALAKDDEDRYEYPPGSGNFWWRRLRIGKQKFLDP